MKNPENRFKTALREGRHQLGLWNTISDISVQEMLAGAGFDWIVIDTEHSPTDVPDVLPALQAMSAYPQVSPVVRPAANDPVLIKRLLDFGAQTLLLPYIQSREEAEAAVRAIRYAPRGIRGMAGLTRAGRYGAVEDYAKIADREICLILQAETAEALDRLEDIASVDGVDGVFIGPADLAASMGHAGELGHPEVTAAIEDAIARLRAIGMPAGILSVNPEVAQKWIGLGTTFTAVGIDLGVLRDGALALRGRF
jgi:4-hydroxy-2-oxoheptanedioate aldolase